MTNLELVLNMLAEIATTEISKKNEPKNLEENKIVAREGGSIAGDARKSIETIQMLCMGRFFWLCGKQLLIVLHMDLNLCFRRESATEKVGVDGYFW